MVGVLSSGNEGAMSNTARPAADEVRNSSKDVSPLMVDGRVLYMLYVLMLFTVHGRTYANALWTTAVSAAA